MVTYTQALIENDFHYNIGCERTKPGSNSVTMIRVMCWRRNGKTKIWKTRPGEFRIPIKHGLYDYSYLTDKNAHLFHVASECEVLNGRN